MHEKGNILILKMKNNLVEMYNNIINKYIMHQQIPLPVYLPAMLRKAFKNVTHHTHTNIYTV